MMNDPNTLNNMQTWIPSQGKMGTQNALPEEDLKAGDLIGEHRNYRLETLLGEGGMGQAWLATEIEGGKELRQVVCKLLPRPIQINSEEMGKIEENFRLTEKLAHPNICPIYGMKHDPDFGWFLVLGYADGGTLAEWLQTRKDTQNGISLSEAVGILRSLASALDYAHRRGVIHRDVKPLNIMFSRVGELLVPWLIDFGISTKIRETVAVTTGEMAVHGTIQYMAPEQWRGKSQNAQTDQYALAVVAYEMLAGKTPFSGDLFTLSYQAVNELPEPISRVAEAVNSALLRALSKKKEERFATCTEFIDALTVSGEVPIKGALPSPPKVENKQKTEDKTIQPETPINVRKRFPGAFLPPAPRNGASKNLPEIPGEFRKTCGEIVEIERTLDQIKNGMYPVLIPEKQVVTEAEKTFSELREKYLPDMELEGIKAVLKKNPYATALDLIPFKPKKVTTSEWVLRFSDILRVLKAEKVFQDAMNQYESHLDIQTSALAERHTELLQWCEKFSRDFLLQVSEAVLCQFPGYDTIETRCPLEELAVMVPHMKKYDLGWSEDDIWRELLRFWNEMRPCVVREIEEKRARDEARLQEILETATQKKKIWRVIRDLILLFPIAVVWCVFSWRFGFIGLIVTVLFAYFDYLYGTDDGEASLVVPLGMMFIMAYNFGWTVGILYAVCTIASLTFIYLKLVGITPNKE